MSKKKRDYGIRYLSICQGDVLLIDFGKGNTGCRTRGIRPSVVISNDATLGKETGFQVIPLYRQPSKAFANRDILIRQADCRGLRYDEYAQGMNIELCKKFRVLKKIGHIKNESVIEELALSIWNLVGHENGNTSGKAEVG